MHAMSIITAASLPPHSDFHDSEEAEEDEGPFFDLDFCSSVRSSSSSSDESDEDLNYFIISLHRSRSASPSYDTTIQFFLPPPPLQFCASEPSAKTGLLQSQYKRSSTNLRTLSFGAKKRTKAAAAFYGGRPSSTCSLRLFMESPADEEEDDVDAGSEPATKTKLGGAPSIKRYLTNISRLLRRSVRRPRPVSSGDPRHGLHRRLRKSRSASAAVTPAPPPSGHDDSLAEKQDGIASAIAHCKESFRRASLSECDSPLLRSRSDPGKCEASS